MQAEIGRNAAGKPDGYVKRHRDVNGEWVKFEAYQELEADLTAVRAQLDTLRSALVGLVGADSREELEQMEAVMRLMPAPAADKAATIDAIHALIATVKS